MLKNGSEQRRCDSSGKVWDMYHNCSIELGSYPAENSENFMKGKIPLMVSQGQVGLFFHTEFPLQSFLHIKEAGVVVADEIVREDIDQDVEQLIIIDVEERL